MSSIVRLLKSRKSSIPSSFRIEIALKTLQDMKPETQHASTNKLFETQDIVLGVAQVLALAQATVAHAPQLLVKTTSIQQAICTVEEHIAVFGDMPSGRHTGVARIVGQDVYSISTLLGGAVKSTLLHASTQTLAASSDSDDESFETSSHTMTEIQLISRIANAAGIEWWEPPMDTGTEGIVADNVKWLPHIANFGFGPSCTLLRQYSTCMMEVRAQLTNGQ
jgi:hypothetical protein